MKSMCETEINNIAKHGECCFVRFGNAPIDMLSEHIDGYLETGLSVFEAKRLGSQILLNCYRTELLYAYQEYAEQKRTVYLAKGEEIDIGGDGEPLLANVQLTEIKAPKIYTTNDQSLFA